jgi:single-stranded-DNA-specific exonuclease
VLEQMLSEIQAEVWGEVEAVERIQAKDRTQLQPADTLIIWTTPPGRVELQAVIDNTHPKTVVVFGIDPDASGVEGFLKRLAGLARYAIEKKGGEAEIARLAAATGQRETAVRLGLKWMEQRGMARVTTSEGGRIHLQAEKGQVRPEAETTLAQLKKLIEETNAYRKYFRTAEKENLL